MARKDTRNLKKRILFKKTLDKKGRGRTTNIWYNIIRVRMDSVIDAIVEVYDCGRWHTL